jgi:formylglycine-generating enzyme required for sulfatase activity
MGTNPSEFRGDPNRPVDNVSWHDAVEFCRRLSELLAEKEARAAYRLPTEAEWEYACRAGTTTRYGFGDDAKDLGLYGAWRSTSQGQSRPVGGLQPNAWGLLDMHGNLWEWCADWYAPAYYAESPTDDPQGPDSGSVCVLRGGSWQSSAPTILRSAYRGGGGPNDKNRCLGFRVARAPGPRSR